MMFESYNILNIFKFVRFWGTVLIEELKSLFIDEFILKSYKHCDIVNQFMKISVLFFERI